MSFLAVLSLLSLADHVGRYSRVPTRQEMEITLYLLSNGPQHRPVSATWVIYFLPTLLTNAKNVPTVMMAFVLSRMDGEHSFISNRLWENLYNWIFKCLTWVTKCRRHYNNNTLTTHVHWRIILGALSLSSFCQIVPTLKKSIFTIQNLKAQGWPCPEMRYGQLSIHSVKCSSKNGTSRLIVLTQVLLLLSPLFSVVMEAQAHPGTRYLGL